MRFWILESPRWLITRGRHEEAQTIVQDMESEIAARGHRFDTAPLPAPRSSCACAIWPTVGNS